MLMVLHLLAHWLLADRSVYQSSTCFMAQDWSFSDVMFVTKKNMANAVATVSKKLENVSETLASTKRHLTKRLENLDWKVEEQIETSKLIASDVDEMKSNLSQIGYDVEAIHQMISGLEGKLEILESKQVSFHLLLNVFLLTICSGSEIFESISCRIPQTRVYGTYVNLLEALKMGLDVGAKLANHSAMAYEERSRKGLQFIAETKESDMVEKPEENVKKDLDTCTGEKVKTVKTRIHRSYPVGFSLSRDIVGSGI
ncbi:hypothetical protein DKX38_003402 [Salix brachista]|uniref:DUF1664 domain-containing protein n=1 Tax=Salix brachista TaxID=2182728 RepID=A0A5N5NQX5_9ROSI|nr:hypothetical protein DKX38_003402 [Salix brachista]